MKALSKKELAMYAGVSMRTFSRWLSANKEALSELGIKPSAHIIPPKGVKFICHQYGIDLPERLT